MQTLRKLLTYDAVYAGFWLAVVIIIFFFPVMIGRQSLADAVGTLYSSPHPATQIKTPWQVDGTWNTIDVIPLVKSEIQMIKEGVPPIWTPYSGGGEAPMASNVVNVYYPLRLIWFLISSSVHAFDWYLTFRFFIAGMGMFFYLRLIGLRRIVALWGGIAYAFSGYFLLYLTYAFLDIDSLIPWLLFAIERYLKKPGAQTSAVIGFFAAMVIMVGYPQSTIIALLFASLYFSYKVVAQVGVGKQLFGPLIHAAFAALAAILIAWPFVADFLVNYLQGKGAGALIYKGASHFSPIFLLHFFVTPAMVPEIAASGHLFDRFYLIIPYFGISVTILAVLSFFIKNKPRELVPLYVWIAFVVLKNAGLPLVNWIGSLPILNQIGWYRAYGTMAAAIVVSAAIAFENILRESPENHLIRWRRFYKFLAGIPIVFAALYFFARNAFLNAYVPNFDFFNRHKEVTDKIIELLGKFPQSIGRFAAYVLQNHGGYFTLGLFFEAAVFATAALVIIHYLRDPVYGRRASIALLVLTAFELWVYMPKIRDGFRYFDPYPQTPPYINFLQNQMKEGGVARTFSVGDVFMGHAGDLYKIQKSQNNASVKPPRYFAFLPDSILNRDSLTSGVTVNQLPEVPEKFFDAYDIRYLLSQQTLPATPWLKLIYDEDIKIYENKNALPKAYLVFEKESAASSEEARSIFYGAAFDPHKSVIVEDAGKTSLPKEAAPSAVSSVVVSSYKSNEVIVESNSDRDDILVLTDPFYYGWNAYLDGKKVPIYPANVMFRGIFMPRGSHAVKFVYEPQWFWPTVVISLATILGVIFGAFYAKTKNEKH